MSSIYSVETIRGLTCLLVVVSHILSCSIPAHGNDSASVTLYAYYTDPFLDHYALQSFRIPLFAMIAGLVYAYKPVSVGNFHVLFQNKVKRLLVPFVCVTVLLFGYYSIKGLVQSQPWNMNSIGSLYHSLFYKSNHLWFLQTLFIVTMIVASLDYLKLLRTPLYWLTGLGLALLVRVWVPAMDFMNPAGVAYLLPPFLLGYGLNRYAGLCNHNGIKLMAAVVALVLIVISNAVLQHKEWAQGLTINMEPTGVLFTILGLCLGYLIIMFMPQIPGFRILGAYSYAIYLFHMYGMFLGMRLTHYFPTRGVLADLGIKLSFSLALPLLIDLTIARYQPVRALLLGGTKRQNPLPQLRMAWQQIQRPKQIFNNNVLAKIRPSKPRDKAAMAA